MEKPLRCHGCCGLFALKVMLKFGSQRNSPERYLGCENSTQGEEGLLLVSQNLVLMAR